MLQAWFHKLMFYLNADALRDRMQYELTGILFLAGLLAVEVARGGWRSSSVSAFLRPKNTDWWDLVSFGLLFFGVRKELSNLFYFGMVAYIAVSFHFSLHLLEGAPAALKVVVILLSYDFFMYWGHRARHEIGWIWPVHEFHHSATRVTLFTNYRVHPLDYIFYYGFTILPLQIFWGMESTDQYLELFAFAVLPGLYSHMRLDTGFGWLGKYVLVSPRFHHWHHVVGPEMKGNYGHAFVFWDRLFGTFREPAAVPLGEIHQGIENNTFETGRAVHAFFSPIWRFYSGILPGVSWSCAWVSRALGRGPSSRR